MIIREKEKYQLKYVMAFPIGSVKRSLQNEQNCFYDWAYKVRKQYNENTFSVFESWLIKYVRGKGTGAGF